MAAGDVIVANTKIAAKLCMRTTTNDVVDATTITSDRNIQTISGWVNMDHNSTFHIIANYGDGGVNQALKISYETGKLIRVELAGTVASARWITGTLINRNWVHFAVVRTFEGDGDGSRVAGDCILYTDGTAVTPNFVPTAAIAHTGNTFRIARGVGGSGGAEAKFADFQIHNRVLTATEIANLALGQSIPDGLVHRWVFGDFSDSAPVEAGVSGGATLTKQFSPDMNMIVDDAVEESIRVTRTGANDSFLIARGQGGEVITVGIEEA